MITFSNKQINEIIELMLKTNWIFIANYIDPALVPLEMMNILRRSGFKKKQVLSYPELAYHFGALGAYLKESELKKISFKKLKSDLKANKLLPLSREEKFALDLSKQRAISGVTGLGNRYSEKLKNIVINSDSKLRSEYENIITNAAKKGIAERKAKRQIIQEIGDLTEDWSRDLDRMVDYIIHDSYDTGRAMSVQKRFGNEAKVYKRVHKNACKHCKRLYIKNENTWEPFVFYVSTLLANGTNIGRKVNDWLPVTGSAHPYCRCDIEYLPSGMKWSQKENRFVLMKPTGRIEEIKKKLKTTITVS